ATSKVRRTLVDRGAVAAAGVNRRHLDRQAFVPARPPGNRSVPDARRVEGDSLRRISWLRWTDCAWHRASAEASVQRGRVGPKPSLVAMQDLIPTGGLAFDVSRNRSNLFDVGTGT